MFDRPGGRLYHQNLVTDSDMADLPQIIDLGCGENKQPGACGVDIQGSQLDLKIDLDRVPWKLPSDHFLVVYMRQSLEHLSEPVKVMQELYRICRHGALIFIQVPNGYCPGFAQDPDHKRAWTLGAFIYFCEEHQWPHDWEPRYTDYGTRFRIIHYHTTGERPGKTPWDQVLYADNLTVILQAIKEDE